MNATKTCTYVGCTNHAVHKSMCSKHYRRSRVCSICDKPVHQAGFCRHHFHAWSTLGDPLAVGRYGSGYTDRNGYRCISIEGVVYKEHRVVMERILGRPMFPNENVHHKNGNRTDNSPDNLELWVKGQPKGQRVEDKLRYARELLGRYQGLDTSKPTRVTLSQSMELKNQQLESRGATLIWDALSKLGSVSTMELSEATGISNTGIFQVERVNPGLFLKYPNPNRSKHDHVSVCWKIAPGASRPSNTLKGCVDENGYRVFVLGGKKVREHRLIMEKHLGRRLLPKENVHHKDGDRLNNDLGNLELWSTSQPPGQRIEDLLTWANGMIQVYGNYTPLESTCKPRF